ncbi:methyltransferase domain-containing protein [Chytriomyces cf. hyalinus JEL632]|nr:methyltransferase domain-containing protein [Chytriomyces cf. hyalinus JEL632]
MSYMRLPPGHQDPTEYIESLSKFLAKFQWLSSIHAYDSLTEDFWNKSWPSEWRALADEDLFESEQLIGLVKDGTVQDSWPQSLKDYIHACKELSLPRSVLHSDFPEKRNVPQKTARFARVILDFASTAAQDSIVNNEAVKIVDVGAGQGYLTHRVSTEYPCVAVDFDQIQTVGSVSRGANIKKGKLKDVRGVGNVPAVNVNSRKEVLYRTIHINSEKLMELVKELNAEQMDLKDGKSTDFMLVGLHACGDLSSIAMLKTFEAVESVKLMAVVPCCFNLLTEPESLDDSCFTGAHGFPASKSVFSAMQRHQLLLGHKSRNLSCQNFDRFDAAGIESNLTGHYKRSLLDALLWHFNLDPPGKDGTTVPEPSEAEPRERKQHKFRLGKLPIEAFEGSFIAYAQAALQRLGLGNRVSEAELQAFISLPQYVNAKRQIFVVHCIKSLLSRVLESLVLMDRYLGITEMNSEGGLLDQAGVQVDVRMLNLFDIYESPRNVVFLARKQRKVVE